MAQVQIELFLCCRLGYTATVGDLPSLHPAKQCGTEVARGKDDPLDRTCIISADHADMRDVQRQPSIFGKEGQVTRPCSRAWYSIIAAAASRSDEASLVRATGGLALILAQYILVH